MNKIKYLFGILSLTLLAACGAAVEDEDRIVLGKNEQAIYVPFGYGTEDDQSACDNNWSGGWCDAPDFRAISVAVMTSTCPDAQFDTQLKAAAERYRKFLVAVGWKVLWDENQGPGIPGDNIVVSIGCNGNISSMGVSDVNVTPVPLGSYECHEDSLGDFCQFQGVAIKVNHNMIKAHPGWAGASVTKRDNLILNIALHELYHAAGLGHRVNAALGSELMAVSIPPTGNTSNFWTIKLTPNSAQRDMLACYNPRSGTQPDDNPACPL